MGLISWYNRLIKSCNWRDMAMLKLCVFFFALLLAKLWMPLLSLDWYWYALVFVLTAIWLVAKVLRSR